MVKLGLVFAGLVSGLLIAAGVFALVWTEFHPATTEVWVASNDIRLANGTMIPAGTEMTVDAYMPEGFVRLGLAINVEGGSLAGFDKITKNVRDLSIPYWVETQ
jgi:hypothetical protein